MSAGSESRRGASFVETSSERLAVPVLASQIHHKFGWKLQQACEEVSELVTYMETLWAGISQQAHAHHAHAWAELLLFHAAAYWKDRPLHNNPTMKK